MTSSFVELQPEAEPLGAVSGFVNEFIDAVEQQNFFDKFSRGETTLLTEYFECFGVPRDSLVIAEGAPGDFLLILVTGKAEIFQQVGDELHVTSEVHTGEMVGEVSFVDGQPRNASCVTCEPSDLAILTRQSFQELQMAHPRLGNKFLMVLLQQNAARLRGAGHVKQGGWV
jgi:CRP-like cAMP-binding protein